MNLNIQNLARVLGGDVAGNGVVAPGPGHSSKDRSLAVTPSADAQDGFIVHSFAGDDPIKCRDFIRDKLGLPPFAAHTNGRGQRRDIEALMQSAIASQQQDFKREPSTIYPYTDASGELLYQVCRFEPKDFRQRRPDGCGGWIWKLDERRVLYRWPDLLKYPDGTVFFCEGEKDADRLAGLNLCATTVAGGSWTQECIDALQRRDVVILQDRDAAGEKRALEAAQQVHGTAATVRVVLLPDLSLNGDVSDWLDADIRRADELAGICLDAPLWEPSAEKSEDVVPLLWIDMSDWDTAPVPEREWCIQNRVPRGQAGLFSGQGGAGKSIIELQKNVAHIIGKDWLGALPEQGPAIYVGTEDSSSEIHIRLATIATHYGTTFNELIAGGLHILCLFGQDATLCAANGKSGRVETTALYKQIYQAAGDIKPINLSIDTLSRCFAGSEIDRVQVYAFVAHMQALATVSGGSVTVLAHPSLAGIASGSGISGSTAWHGAFRYRHYLTGTKSEDGEQPDNDLRQLDFKKNQYGPLGESILLRYQNGLFLPEGGTSSLEKVARESQADELFLSLLARCATQNVNISHKKTSNSYAPSNFAKEPEALKGRLRKSEFEAAMRRLFAGNKIRVEQYGRPSDPRERLVVT